MRQHHSIPLVLADGTKVHALGCGGEPTAKDVATLTDFAEELRLRARSRPTKGEEN